MTVAELIKILKAYPPKMPVVVDGYEGDFDEPVVRRAERERGVRNVHPSYFGCYPDVTRKNDPDAEPVLAIMRLPHGEVGRHE